MRASGAAILGAAAVGVILIVSSSASAAPAHHTDSNPDAEVQLAMNYYANALTDPVSWSDGQLKSLEGILTELGFTTEAANIKDMRIGLYGDHPEVAAAPLPDIHFLPQSEIDAIATANEQDLQSMGGTPSV